MEFLRLFAMCLFITFIMISSESVLGVVGKPTAGGDDVLGGLLGKYYFSK